jgi:hypothetical protein
MEIDEEYLKYFNKAKIDLNEDIPYPPNVLSIGYHTAGGIFEYPTTFGTEGNFSAITGAGKSRKSFLKSLLVASYIGGDANKFAPDIKSHRDKDKDILDFDTEQSKFHCQRTFKRVEQIVGKRYKKYYPFALRQFSHYERLDFIEKTILLPPVGTIGLVMIDGIADLVSDVNDLKECNAVVQKLMEWTDKSKCHLIVVIHTNHDSQKATGHLGSAVIKKAETVCFLTKEETITKVSFTATRGYHIDDFWFGVDNDGLPVVKENTNVYPY